MTTHTPSLGAPFSPDSDQMLLDPHWWMKRVGLAVAIGSLAGGLMGALGARIVTPGEALRAATAKNIEQDTAIARLRAVTDSLGHDRATDRFLLCVLVKRSQPNGAMPIKECP